MEVADAAAALKRAAAPLIIAGGGVHYAFACEALAAFAERHRIPVAETQAGKGAVAWDHPCAVGAVGVTGSAAANALAAEADVVLAIGTRLADFTTASRSLFHNRSATLIALNVAGFDAVKHGALPLVADAKSGLEALDHLLASWAAPGAWNERARTLSAQWNEVVERATAPSNTMLPTDAQVLGAVNRAIGPEDLIVCAAGGLPGELHKLWRVQRPGTYHVEYGYSCMGYEIAGGLGVKMALPERQVYVLVGDGSYLMMNSEIATSVMLDRKLTVVLLDNGGFGCIERLQRSCGGASFNNLFASGSGVDFAAHAASLGAKATKVTGIAELEAALAEARSEPRTTVIVIATDPAASTAAGGAWWDVAVPEVRAGPRSEPRAPPTTPRWPAWSATERRCKMERKRLTAGEPEAAAGNGLLDRRGFLAAASLGSLAMFGPQPAVGAEELAVEPWMTQPGSPFVGYGQPSKFEAKVVRTFASAPGTTGTGSSRTPLHALDGTITPNGLHFERHHDGIPDIDPDAHRLLIHGLVKRPLVFTLEALARYPMETSHRLY